MGRPKDTAKLTITERLSRRTPVQGRSVQTVESILEATSRLLIAGREINTNIIAAEADLSVGALYRFFPDKQAIFDAIAVKHINEFQRSATLVMLTLGTLSGPDLVGGLIDHFVAFLDERPDFRAIAFGGHISEANRHRYSLPDKGSVQVLKKFMQKTFGAASRQMLDLKLKIAVETGERLIQVAFEQSTLKDRHDVVAELKTMLARYLFVKD